MSSPLIEVGDQSEFFDTIFSSPASTTTPTTETPSATSTTTEPAAVEEPQDVFSVVFGSKPEETATVHESAKATEGKKETTTTPADSPDDEEFTKQVYKHSFKKLIDKGVFADLEEFDSIDFDEDTAIEILEAQVDYKVDQKLQEYKQSNDVINGIISAIEKGIDPDKVLDLFKEQQSVTQIDKTTPEGKTELIKRYFETLGWDQKTITRELKKIDVEGEEELNEKFALAESKLGEHFTKEQQRLIAEQEEQQAKERVERETKARNTYQSLLDSGVKDKDAKDFLVQMYQPRWKLADGTVITDLDKKIMEIQNDPKAYTEYAQFVLNKEKYLKSIAIKAENKAVDTVNTRLKLSPKPQGVTNVTPAPQSKPANTAKSLFQTLL